MKTILFITTANKNSEEATLWDWPQDSDGWDIPECAVCSYPDSDSKSAWQVKAFRSLNCQALYNKEWQYDNLKRLITDNNGTDECAVNKGTDECAVFFHAASQQLDFLREKFTAAEREKYIFQRYSSQSCTSWEAIKNFATNNTEEEFDSLWKDHVEPHKKEVIINKLCRLRYQLLTPLVAIDILHKYAYDTDKINAFIQKKDRPYWNAEDVNKKTKEFKQYFDSNYKCWNNLELTCQSICSLYLKILSASKDGLPQIDGFPKILADLNQAIIEKSEEASA